MDHCCAVTKTSMRHVTKRVMDSRDVILGILHDLQWNSRELPVCACGWMWGLLRSKIQEQSMLGTGRCENEDYLIQGGEGRVGDASCYSPHVVLRVRCGYWNTEMLLMRYCHSRLRISNLYLPIWGNLLPNETSSCQALADCFPKPFRWYRSSLSLLR